MNFDQKLHQTLEKIDIPPLIILKFDEFGWWNTETIKYLKKLQAAGDPIGWYGTARKNDIPNYSDIMTKMTKTPEGQLPSEDEWGEDDETGESFVGLFAPGAKNARQAARAGMPDIAVQNANIKSAYYIEPNQRLVTPTKKI